MAYRVVYDVRDEAGWFLLDAGLMVALGGVVSVCLFALAADGWLMRPANHPPRRVGRLLVRIGVVGCVVFAGLLVAWAVGYWRGGPVSAPVGRVAWLLLSGIILFAGLHTLRYPVPLPPPQLSGPKRLGLLVGAAAVATGAALLPWFGYSMLENSQAALNSGDVVVVEGPITEAQRTKQGTRLVVAGTVFRVGGMSYGHLGREVHLRPGLPVRVTHRAGAILLFEADD